MQWECEVRRVSLDNITMSHGVHPDHRSRTPGPPDLTGGWLWGYTVLDGNHRVARARREGKGSMVARIWRKVRR